MPLKLPRWLRLLPLLALPLLPAAAPRAQTAAQTLTAVLEAEIVLLADGALAVIL